MDASPAAIVLLVCLWSVLLISAMKASLAGGHWCHWIILSCSRLVLMSSTKTSLVSIAAIAYTQF